MNETVREMKKFLSQCQVPTFGMTRSDLLENDPPGYRPSDILPSARSILCLGIPLPRGIFQCHGRSIESTWRAQNTYYRKIDEILLHLCNIIEEDGNTAVPVYGCFPMDLKKGELWGYVSLVNMADVVGIGKIGKNGLLFNSAYGPKLILGGIVTSASLPQVVWPGIDETGCPEDCFICQDHCPAQAIERNGKVNMLTCIKHSTNAPILLSFLSMKKFSADEAQRLNNTVSIDEHNMNTCIQCVSSCPYI